MAQVPNPFWHPGEVLWKTIFPWIRERLGFWNDSGPFTFIVHFFPIIITPALLQVIRRWILEAGDFWHRQPALYHIHSPLLNDTAMAGK